MKKIIFLILNFMFVLATNLFAQDQPLDQNENIELLRQNGQIYLVVLVLVTIFAGIILMLVRIERKLGRLENQQIRK